MRSAVDATPYLAPVDRAAFCAEFGLPADAQVAGVVAQLIPRKGHRYLLAALVGGVVVVYAFGFVIQSALTGAPLAAVALASMGFVVGDAIKAVVASLAAAGLSKLGR